MEASSPLAAMQAPSFMPAWGRNDMYTSHAHAHLARATGFGQGTFDFRDLSMKAPPKPDYFAMQPVRGSSPAASLAADLSQNFHIDMRQVPLDLRTEACTDGFAAPNCQPRADRSLRRISSGQLMVVVSRAGKVEVTRC
jgi:M-phase inducer tyrosine phosphatase